MSRQSMLLALPVVVGLPLLLWALHAARDEGAPEPSRAHKKATSVAAVSRAPEGETPAVGGSPGSRAALPPRSPLAAVSPETAAIQDRIQRMEERVRDLEVKRDGLVLNNKDLEKELARKGAEASARTMAEWRVKSWEGPLGLNDTQKRSLVDLLSQWGKEDAGRPAVRETWIGREEDIRSRLTVEQAAKLHDFSTTQAQQQWKHMGMTLGSMAGASSDELARLQPSLGDCRIPQEMVLPEAHGADYQGLLHEAAVRARAVLTPEEIGRLNRFGLK